MGSIGRTVEIVLGYRIAGRVERHTNTLETVVVLGLKSGRAACRDRASLTRRKISAVNRRDGPEDCNSDEGGAALTKLISLLTRAQVEVH